MNKQLIDIIFIMNKSGAKYWVDSGTLLGLIREGDILNNDTDIDIGVTSTQIKIVNSILPKFKEAGYKINKQYYSKMLTKWILTPYNIDKQKLRVDIQVFREYKGNYWSLAYKIKSRKKTNILLWSVFISLKNRIFLGLHRIRRRYGFRETLSSYYFQSMHQIKLWWIPKKYYEQLSVLDSHDINTPYDAKEYLEFRYGDWEKKRTLWSYWDEDRGLKEGLNQQILDNHHL